MGEPIIDDAYELSPLQQGMLFHSLASPSSQLYLITVDYTLTGALDESAWLRAWDALVGGNDVLRTSFDWQVADRPIQVVNREIDHAVEVDDWRGVAAKTISTRIGELVERQRRPMPLDQAPLVRLALIRVADREWRLIWTFHHILLEGWSVALLLKQLAALYEIECGRHAVVPSAPRYREYLDWVGTQDLGAAEAYWRRTLAGFQGAVSLDGRSAAAAPAATVRHQQHQLGLGKALGRRLQAFAREQRLTVNTILQGAWALLLSRHSGTDDVVFGAVVSGREVDVPGVGEIVGLCVNTLPMRVSIDGGERAGDWLRKLQTTQATMRRYEWTSLLQVRSWSDVGAGRPLFETIFAYENWAGDSAPGTVGDVALTSAASIQGGTGYPLAVAVIPGTSPVASFEYDTARFDAAFIARLARQYVATVAALCDDAACRVGRITGVDRDERAEVVERWNATVSPYPRDASIAELFAEIAAAHGPATAVDFSDRTLTYAQLDSESNRLARHLQTLGVGPDTLVGLCTERSAAMVVAMVGIIKAGGAYVPLDPAYPADRLAAMAADAQLRVVITERALEAVVPARPGCTRVLIDADWAAIAAGSDQPVRVPVTASHLAYVIYTSGSTGTPKGAAIPQRGVVRLVRGTNYIAIEPRDRIAQASSSSFDAATFEIWGALLNGAAVVGIAKETALSPEKFAAELETRGVTVLFVTTALLNVFSRKPAAAFRSLRYLLFGGEAVDPTAVRRMLRDAPPQQLLHMYGPTETTTYASWFLVRSVAGDATTIPIGRGISQTQLYVLDAHLEPVGAGMPGELFVGGDGGARGYLNRPDVTADRFVPDPFSPVPGARMYRTGDLVRWNTDGQIEFIGRLDGQVKIRGFRMELGEIEAALTSHPAVSQAVVAPFGQGAEKRLGAWVVLREAAAPGVADQLRDHLRGRLPDYMVPAAFTWVDSMPLNANGKVDKQRLPEPTTDRQLGSAYVAPRSAIEETIAGIWRELLGVERVGVRDNLFDLGAHSLLLIQAQARIVADLGVDLPIVALFEFPTIEALAGRIASLSGDVAPAIVEPPRPAAAPVTRGQALAVIALAGRFPGAPDVETFWTNLRDGVEGVRTLSEDELRRAGVDDASLRDPNYVPARGVLEGADLFDAAFFGYSPREAELMDPQHRVFLECASEALERAGYNPDAYPGRIGVYAGASPNSYLLNLIARPDAVASAGGLQLLIGSGSDFLPTRVSYKLNLRGPSVNVQTACSTSLVAVHQACQSLRNGECEIALAGGVSVGAPLVRGYMYSPAGIGAPDGHCRAFDAGAKGTVPGHGVGVVVLKRLDDAIRDGDTIHAVIRGTAINNDGAGKVGFTAPSVEGQAEVIASAHADARIAAADVSYVEAHGTGTTLGDPIEIAALTRVFGESDGVKTCAIGSVKSTIGHLDGAAGVANLIKVVLAVSHGELPPNLHFTEPNPELHLDRTPFEVNARLKPWRPEGPRLAGVSSFGIGGTNAHVVVEEPPAVAAGDVDLPWQLIPLSARTPAALAMLADRLGDYFGAADVAFGDAAYTLQVGRRSHGRRRFVIASSAADAARALKGGEAAPVISAAVEPRDRTAIFMFSGQGSQHHAMASGLYETDSGFRADVDRGAALFEPLLQCDLRQLMFAGDAADASARLKQTQLTQAALFVTEYALARLWMRCGVRPAAMIGHSVGEYVAACLAGVFSFEDAVAIVAARGRLMQEQPAGAMLAVMLPERDILPRLTPDVTVAVLNGPSMTVVSGPVASIAALESRLAADGVAVQRVDTSHAFHSAMMQPAADAFAREMARIELRAPVIPFVSNVTGTWITPQQATAPEYWAGHLRQPVKFADGIRTLAGEPGRVFIEVGPGRALAGFAREMLARDVPVIATLRHKRGSEHDYATFLEALGRAWLAGLAIDWQGLHSGSRRRRVPLPTYPFQRQRYWIEPVSGIAAPAPRSIAKRSNPGDWMYVPVWARSAAPPRGVSAFAGETWLVFADACGVGKALAAALAREGAGIVSVRAGDRFRRETESSFVVDPARAGDYDLLIDSLKSAGVAPSRVVHLWSVSRERASDAADFAAMSRVSYYSVLYLTQAFVRAGIESVRLTVITNDGAAVSSDDRLSAAKAATAALCTVIPQEHPTFRTHVIDVQPYQDRLGQIADQLMLELAGDERMPTAYRGPQRWVPRYDPATTASGWDDVLRDRGVYVITGGLGQVGVALAEHLAATRSARLVLIGRSVPPEPATWDRYLASHAKDDRTAQQIRSVRRLEQLGAEVMVCAGDVADAARLREILVAARQRFGAIHGVYHAAGTTDGSGMGPVATLDVAGCEAQFKTKVWAVSALQDAIADCAAELDFCLVTSSLSTVLGGLGFGAYAAANAAMNAMVDAWRDYPVRWMSVDLDAWTFESAGPKPGLGALAMTASEGVGAIERAIQAADLRRVVVSTADLDARLDRYVRGLQAPTASTLQARPEASSFVAPSDDLERMIAEVWQELLGIDRVGRRDDFFELGGHSLMATRVIAHLKQRCGLELPLKVFFEAPRLADFAERVSALKWAAESRPAAGVAIADREEIEI